MNYQPYPAYGPTVVAIGIAFPGGWPAERLRFSVLSNPVRSEVAHWDDETAVSFVPMDAVGEQGEIDPSQEKPLAEVYNGYTYFLENDILIAKITPCFENGKGAIARGLKNGVGFGTTEFHVLRPLQGMSERWLFYLTKCDFFRKIGGSEMLGAGGQKRLPEEFIRNLRIGIPSFSEQEGIANFLDWKTGQIDALIAKKQALIEKLKEKRLAVITQAVTKGLDPSVAFQDSGIPWLDQMPKHWQLMKFGYRTRIEEGQVDPEFEPFSQMVLIAPNHIESNTGIVSGLASAHEQGAISGKYLVRNGDVVYSKIRPHLNKCALSNFDGLCSADMYPIRTEPPLSPNFLHYWMLAQPFLDYATVSSMRVAMPKLNRETLNAAPLLVPPADEQLKIVKFLDSATKKIDSFLDKADLAISYLTEYCTALITAATTGQIDVRNVVIPAHA